MTLDEAVHIVRAICHERAYVQKDPRAAEAVDVVCQSLVQPAPVVEVSHGPQQQR